MTFFAMNLAKNNNSPLLPTNFEKMEFGISFSLFEILKV